MPRKDRIGELEQRMDAVEAQLEEHTPPEPPAPSLLDILRAWPKGVRGLAEHVGVSPVTLYRLANAWQETFSTVLAAKCAQAFQNAGLGVFEKPVTTERLRQAWLREKEKTDA